MAIGKILDISVPITPAMPVYNGDPAVNLERTSDMSRGDPYTVTKIGMSVHTGTHVDAPSHFIRGGKTVEQLDLDALVGPVRVIDLSLVDRTINAHDLQAAGAREATERILLKTGNSALWRNSVFVKEYVGLGPDGAQWLVDRGARLVGIDYMSVEAFGSTDFATHHILLNAGVIILEGLNLESIMPGIYELVCLPLRIGDAEGAPARAVLIQE